MLAAKSTQVKTRVRRRGNTKGDCAISKDAKRWQLSPVTVYARAVVSGKIVAGRLVRLACERHLSDLKLGGKRGLVWDIDAARHAIDFFGHLRHSTGEWAGEPFTLQPWQQFVVGSLYGWKRKNGLRRFRTAYVEVARKNGKSVLLAGTALYALIAAMVSQVHMSIQRPRPAIRRGLSLARLSAWWQQVLRCRQGSPGP